MFCKAGSNLLQTSSSRTDQVTYRALGSATVKKMLKKHNQTYHTPWIKCKLCDKTFEKTCDLEFHIKVDHGSVETLQCEKCDKTFALAWRFKKHQEIHASKNIENVIISTIRNVVPLK